MENLGVVDEEELDQVCSERETALDRPLHHWEREALHLHLRNESLKALRKFLVKVKKRKKVGKLWCGNLVCAATNFLIHFESSE